MYVTRPLSHYIRHPESLSIPPEGPNSGYLVLQDRDSETVTCFGLCKEIYLKNLPFPQNKNLTIHYDSYSSKDGRDHYSRVVFIPVLNQPLSTNRYYVIKPRGSKNGNAYVCSHGSMATSCFCCNRHEYMGPLNPNNLYQQFQVSRYGSSSRHSGQFVGLPLVPDGIPPNFLRRRGWRIWRKKTKKFEIGEALGVNATLRAQLPTFDFPLNAKDSEPVIVGKWYCPFMFINDGTLKDQMNRSMYYEMTLEQRWEQIFTSEKDSSRGSTFNVSLEVKTEMVLVGGREAVWDERNVVNGVIWFKSTNKVGEEQKIGLSSLIIQRMKWEVTRFGWVKGEKRRAKVNRTEDFTGVVGWSRFGCYVLVERFNLKRMDGSVALTYDFKHTQLTRSKRE